VLWKGETRWASPGRREEKENGEERSGGLLVLIRRELGGQNGVGGGFDRKEIQNVNEGTGRRNGFLLQGQRKWVTPMGKGAE